MRAYRAVEIFKSAVKNHSPAMILGAGILVLWLADLVQGNVLFPGLKKNWNDHSQAFAGWATLLIALSVWINGVRRDWVQQLPQKLSVIFRLDASPVMMCIRADLADESDMRPLAQQIGAQMAGIRDLKFKVPLIKQSGRDVAYDEEFGHFVDNMIEVVLTEMPPIANDDVKNGRAYLLWKSPFPQTPDVVRFDARNK